MGTKLNTVTYLNLVKIDVTKSQYAWVRDNSHSECFWSSNGTSVLRKCCKIYLKKKDFYTKYGIDDHMSCVGWKIIYRYIRCRVCPEKNCRNNVLESNFTFLAPGNENSCVSFLARLSDSLIRNRLFGSRFLLYGQKFKLLWFIQMKFKRKTFFSKFYFSNLVICWCKKVLKLHCLKKDI